MAARVYARLQERLKAANAFDFDDLLLYAYLLLKNHADVLDAYQDRFRYLMVDEYQDTNHAQYAITGLLAAKHQNIMVVGDDDQSIYSWRGADIRNILEFEQDYPNAHTVKLEQNYRSVGNVLAAANAVIANNQHRKQKKLFTSADDGEKISVYLAADERDEGRWIAGEIERRRAGGTSYDDMAVFYRTNAQSRMLEDMLLRAGVPYRIVGGTRFFDRAEIRDVMAYLTLVVNPADDIAAKRVVNVPRRGVGKSTVERVEQFAREMDMPFLDAAELAIVDPELRASAQRALGEFVGLLKEARTYAGDLRKVIEMIIDKSGLVTALELENTDEARGRVENIKEFLGVVDEFSETHDEEDSEYAAPTEEGAEGREPVRVLRGDSLADFIEWVRLRTDLDTMTEDGNAVTLMTVHSSKGLEFDCVFVAGMEETLFPHMNSVGDAASVEEERRLAYVAITRARKRLYLTCAQQRQIFGQTSREPRLALHPARSRRELRSDQRAWGRPAFPAPDGRSAAAAAALPVQRHGSGRRAACSAARAHRALGSLVRRVPQRPRVRGVRRCSIGGIPRRLAPHRCGGESRTPARRRPSEDSVRRRRHRGPQDLRPRHASSRSTATPCTSSSPSTGQTKKLLKDYAPIVKIG